jgi:hypothetical protein
VNNKDKGGVVPLGYGDDIVDCNEDRGVLAVDFESAMDHPASDASHGETHLPIFASPLYYDGDELGRM